MNKFRARCTNNTLSSCEWRNSHLVGSTGVCLSTVSPERVQKGS